MGLKLFGNSFSINDGYVPQTRWNNIGKSPIDPDPEKFHIDQTYQRNNHLVAVVIYPNCINYEGKKILLFKDTNSSELKSQTILDPHFSKKGLSPFARFEPTEKGLNAALALCDIL